MTAPPEPERTVASGTTGATLGRVLRTGVVISASLLAIGLLLAAVRGDLGGGSAELDSLRSGEGGSSSAAEVVAWAGLAVLMATPVVRVAVAGWDLRRRGDRNFAAVAGLVFALLVVSLAVDLLR